jgi:transposase
MEDLSMGRRKFTSEFKRSAVGLVLDGQRTQQQAAANLGLSPTTLSNWVRQHKKHGQNGTAETDLRKQLAQTERELKQVKLERDILKKATAFFAKENL